jgi:hypothetical protein
MEVSESILKNVLPHKKTETGTMYTLKEEVTDDVTIRMKMHVPDGYVETAPIGFFRKDYDKGEIVSLLNTLAKKKDKDQRDDADLFKFLLEHLDRIDEVAHDVGILDNISQLVAYGLYHKVIKFQTKLDGLFYPNPIDCKSNRGNHLIEKTSYYIFMITGLEQEIEFGGAKIQVTKEELLPVCNLATCFMSLYTHASDKLVTCYSIDYKIIRLLDEASRNNPLSVGRFRFSSGMCRELSTMEKMEKISTISTNGKPSASPKNQVIDITKYGRKYIGMAKVPKYISTKPSNQSIEDRLPTYISTKPSNQSIEDRLPTYDEVFNRLMYDSTDFKIRELCMQSMPCQHYVYTNGAWSLLDGRRIKQLLKERKLVNLLLNLSCWWHFKCY